MSIKIGDESITEESSAKLLGIIVDNNQKWTSQIKGSGGTINALNSRLYLLKRLGKVICKQRLRRVADSLYTSEIRYGVQLFGKVRLHDDDPKNALLNSLQTTQNKFARFLNGSKLGDKINNNSIYKKI